MKEQCLKCTSSKHREANVPESTVSPFWPHQTLSPGFLVPNISQQNLTQAKPSRTWANKPAFLRTMAFSVEMQSVFISKMYAGWLIEASVWDKAMTSHMMLPKNFYSHVINRCLKSYNAMDIPEIHNAVSSSFSHHGANTYESLSALGNRNFFLGSGSSHKLDVFSLLLCFSKFK